MQGVHLRKYGVETTIDFEVYEVDGINLRVDWVPAAADCEVMKDEGASTQCTNTATDEGSTYSIVLTATEMQAARLVLKVVDAATKVFLDKVIVIETYGNASASHAMDFDDSVRAGLTALPLAAADAAGGLAISDLGGVDMDALAADAARLTAARAQILTDWINGGRLDLLLDAIPTTAMRGTDSANTTVPDAAGVIAVLLPAALVGGRMDANVSAINNDNSAAVSQAKAFKGILPGAAVTGTLSTTEMTTDLTITVADQLNGRVIVFADDTTTAALRGQAQAITATTVSGAKLGFAAFTTAPVNGDTFTIY